MKSLKYNLDYVFLFCWLGITAVYSILYFIFLDSSHIPSIGGYITGFFGLFTPIGPLSLLAGTFSPVFIFANLVSLGLILLMSLYGNKVFLGKITKIVIILAALLFITFIADFIRGDFTSWWIFTHGDFPHIN